MVRDLRFGIAAASGLYFCQQEKRCRIRHLTVSSRNAEHLNRSDIDERVERLFVPVPKGVTAPNPVTTTLCISSCRYFYD